MQPGNLWQISMRLLTFLQLTFLGPVSSLRNYSRSFGNQQRNAHNHVYWKAVWGNSSHLLYILYIERESEESIALVRAKRAGYGQWLCSVISWSVAYCVFYLCIWVWKKWEQLQIRFKLLWKGLVGGNWRCRSSLQLPTKQFYMPKWGIRRNISNSCRFCVIHIYLYTWHS